MSAPGPLPPSVQPNRRARRRLLLTSAGVAVLVLAGLLAWVGGAPTPAVAALALAAVVPLAVPLGRGAAWLVGPLFFHELVRLARRGRSTLLRCAYPLLMLAGLYAVYTLEFPGYDPLRAPFDPGPRVQAANLARFGATFVGVVLAVQAAAVVVLTPAYLAGAVAEERERRTLELLFTTPLTDREIILGKLLGRLAHLAGVLLAGLPVLALVSLWGGVEPVVLLGGFAVTGLTLLSVGGLSILCSVLARDALTAVIACYAIVLPVAFGCLAVPGCSVSSPLAFALQLEGWTGTGALSRYVLGAGSTAPTGPVGSVATQVAALVAAYAVIHGLIAVGCVLTAVGGLRGGEPPREPEPPLSAPRVRRLPLVEETRRRAPGPTGFRHPVTDQPLLWKEVLHGAGPLAGVQFRVLYPVAVGCGLAVVLVGVAACVLPVVLDERTHAAPAAALAWWIGTAVNALVRVLTVGLTGAWCLGLAWRAAGTVTRERQKGTLDGLLTLPGDRRAILDAKWLGGILRLRWLGYLLAAVWTVGLLCGAVHPVAVVLLVLACTVHVAFLASLGLWLSLVSRTTVWAYLCVALILLLMFVGPLAARAYTQALLGLGPGSWEDEFAELALTPPRAWWFLGFGWHEFRDGLWDTYGADRAKLAAVLVGLGLYAVAAGTLWLAARRRFESEFRTVGG